MPSSIRILPQSVRGDVARRKAMDLSSTAACGTILRKNLRARKSIGCDFSKSVAAISQISVIQLDRFDERPAAARARACEPSGKDLLTLREGLVTLQ
jgi:hypothetical protein